MPKLFGFWQLGLAVFFGGYLHEEVKITLLI